MIPANEESIATKRRWLGLAAAMADQRYGVRGDRTAHAILALNNGIAFERSLVQTGRDPRGDPVDLGLLLLRMSGKQLSKGIEFITGRVRETRGVRDFSLGSGKDIGITVHPGYLPTQAGLKRLVPHVQAKKFQQKAPSWFGIAIELDDQTLLFGCNAEFPREKIEVLDEASRSLSNGWESSSWLGNP